MIFEEFEKLLDYPLDGVCEVDEVRTNITIANDAVVEGYFSNDKWPFIIVTDRRNDRSLQWKVDGADRDL